MLGEEAPRFIEEAKAVAKIQADAAAKHEREQQRQRAQQDPGHDRESLSGLGGALAGMGSGSTATSPMSRPPPRRGMSDSGAANSAVVAAATAAMNAAAAAAGSSGGGGALMGVPQLALGGRGRELLKSNSGTCQNKYTTARTRARASFAAYGAPTRTASA